MPSYLASGLVEGISPFATELFKSKLKEKEEQRKAEAQRKAVGELGIMDAVRVLSRGQPDQQAVSEDIERTAGSQMVLPGTPPLDLSALTQQRTGQEQGEFDQAGRYLGALSTAGIKTTDIGGLEANPRGAGSTVQTGYFDPESGEFIKTGEVNKGSIIRNKRPTVEQDYERYGARSQAGREGRGYPADKAAAMASADRVTESIDQLESMFDYNPNLFEMAMTPGARTNPDENVKRAVALLNTITTESQFAKGGKVLTSYEKQAVDKTLGSLVRGEKVSREQVRALGMAVRKMKTYMSGKDFVGSESQSGEVDDFADNLRSQGFEIVGTREE